MYKGSLVLTQVMDFMPMKNIKTLLGEIQRQFQRQAFHLSRSVPDHGFCPVDVSRKFERLSLSPLSRQKTG